ncbi:glycosyltransferase [Spongisporangium articulatum]|uniref:Glycosyltransferase n=1 Tax=Spongisporangium articulatum TaxID=3362603 RepID=A0ABW8ARI9_9ACTN
MTPEPQADQGLEPADDVRVERLEVTGTPVAPDLSRLPRPRRPLGRPLGGARILLVAPTYPATRRSSRDVAAAPYQVAAARRLAQVAERVTVLTAARPGDPALGEAPGGRRVVGEDGDVTVVRHRLAVPRRFDGAALARYEFTFVRRVGRSPVLDAPDVVVGVTPTVGAAVAAARLARHFDARLLIVVQDVLSADPRSGGAVRAVLNRAEGIALREADEVAVEHAFLRAGVRAHGVDADRIHVVANPRASTPLERSAARHRLGWPAADLLAVRTGPLMSEPAAGTLLRAARLLAHRGGRPRLVLVGEGRRHEGLRAAAEGLSGVGFVTPPDSATYPYLLAAADVLVVTEPPDRPDPAALGRLLAGLAAGRPVVAALHADGKAAAEAARAGTAVRVVAPDAPAALADALADLADDASRAAMAATAEEFARARLHGPAAGERLERLVESMLWRGRSDASDGEHPE